METILLDCARMTGRETAHDYLAQALPELRILRLDLDSTSRAGSHTEILRAFQAGEADVLVGTQMVSKGFDFPKVTLAAVLHIDGILNLLPKYATYYFCKANLPRGLDANILAEKAFIAGLRGNVYESVQNAYRSALNNANFNDVVFVGGSNFTVAEII